jgi:hypothetical protein
MTEWVGETSEGSTAEQRLIRKCVMRLRSEATRDGKIDEGAAHIVVSDLVSELLHRDADVVAELRNCAELLREGQAQSDRRRDPGGTVPLRHEQAGRIIAALTAAAELTGPR